MRYVLLIVCTIILPRLALALTNTVQLARLRRRMALSCTAEPRRTILRQDAGAARNALLLWASSTDTARREAFAELLPVTGLADTVCSLPSDPWREEAPGALPEGEPEPMIVAWVVDLAATPEDEVHGRYLESIKTRFGSQRVTLLLCTDTLAERFGPNDDRLRARTALWCAFAAQYGLRALPVSLSNAEMRCDAARRWAQALQ